MSTSNDSSIPVEVLTNLQEFRLLELPPPLFEGIRSDASQRLTLKASRFQGLSANAVLCTEDRTFQIRQVQSSNSIYIVQTSESEQDPNDLSIHLPRLSAIGQCPSTLELVAGSPDAKLHLKQVLPNFSRSIDRQKDQSELGEPLSGSVVASKEGLILDAPFSRNEFNAAWSDMCCFEFSNRCYIPVNAVLLEVWRTLLNTATIEGLDLGKPFPLLDFYDAADGVALPLAIFEALMQRLKKDGIQASEGFFHLDAQRSTVWVGGILLESQQSEIEVETFLRLWHDNLPEIWKNNASIRDLENNSSRPSSNTIMWSGASSLNSAKSTASATSSKSGRNWHEKFKKARS